MTKISIHPHANRAKHNVSRRTLVRGSYLQPRQPSRPPETVAQEANEEVRKLEAAWRREHCSRGASSRRIEDDKSPFQNSPCSRKDGFLSEGRGCHQEGNRAKLSVPSGGPGAARVHSRGSERQIDAARDAQNDAGSTVWRWSSQHRSNPSHGHF